MTLDIIMKQKEQDMGDDQCFKTLESEMEQSPVTVTAVKSGQHFNIDFTFGSLNSCLKPVQGEISKQVK